MTGRSSHARAGRRRGARAAVVVGAVLVAAAWCRPAPPPSAGPESAPGTVVSSPPPGSGSAEAPSTAPVPQGSPSPVQAPPGVDRPPADPLVTAARTALAALPVRPAGPSNGYSREAFGQAWSDDVSVEGGHDGCDTRNDVLRRDLREVVLKPGTHGCVVQSGVLVDPYTGGRVDFARGGGPVSVQIDHVVPLADAWRTGASALSPDRRRDLANDPLDLLAVAAAVNTAKSDGDASRWLPPLDGARCGYVSRQVLVKQRYGLWVTPEERAAMDRVFSACG